MPDPTRGVVALLVGLFVVLALLAVDGGNYLAAIGWVVVAVVWVVGVTRRREIGLTR